MASTQIDRITSLASDAALKVPCRVASTGSDLSEYFTTGGLPVLDGVQLDANDRVLVKDNTDETTNGIYIASTSPWVRSADFQNNNTVVEGTLVTVTDGTGNGGMLFQQTGANPITFGTSDITFAVWTGSGTSGVSPGSYTLADITVDADGRVTAASNGSIGTTGVSAGSYTNTNLTVGTDGRITAAADGSSSGGVSSLTAGTGISVSASTGSVTIANEGVTEITAGSNVTVSGSTGSVTISTSAGAVSSFNTRTGAVTLETSDWTGVMPATYGAIGTYTFQANTGIPHTPGTSYAGSALSPSLSGTWLCTGAYTENLGKSNIFFAQFLRTS